MTTETNSGSYKEARMLNHTAHQKLSQNCKASDLDPALMRPGRLVSHRVFRKLSSNEVSALANHYGSNTPPSGECTLAEIFSETIAASKVSPRVGFGLS